MQITFHNQTDQAKRYPVASVIENVRGHDLMKAPEFADLLAGQSGFSVSIAQGRGELWLKRINGKWHQKVDSVDQVFGFINGKYRALEPK